MLTISGMAEVVPSPHDNGSSLGSFWGKLTGEHKGCQPTSQGVGVACRALWYGSPGSSYCNCLHLVIQVTRLTHGFLFCVIPNNHM